jgi:integrase
LPEQMRELGKLTSREVATKRGQGRYSDGGGLYLQVSPTGTKSWLFRYTRFGRSHQLGLGAAHTVTLADARERARRLRLQLVDGLDPLHEKRTAVAAAKIAEARRVTFRECAEQFLRDSPAARKWTNDEHRRQWRSSLEQYAYPRLGSLPVSQIDTAIIKSALLPIWHRVPETASRVRGRVERILEWATTSGHRAGENPATWRKFKDILGTPPAQEHHAALPYGELSAFMSELRRRDGTSARALEFLILTATRTNEAVSAKWGEIDLNQKVWTVPAGRTKTRKDHRVPLSDAAVGLLKSLPADNECLFPGITRKTLHAYLRRLSKDATVHGFRATFRTWAAERTSFPHEVAEQCLAHSVSEKVVRAYKRTTLFDQRRRLMDTWAKFARSPVASGANVVALHG